MKKDYVKYIVSLLMFGTNGIAASFISLSSYEIVLLRTLTGSLFLAALFFIKRQRITFLQNKRHFLFLVLSGIAMGASWMFLYEAYQQIGVSIASLVYYCGPVVVMALSPLLFGEKLTRIKTAGFCTVFCGLILINIQAFSEEQTSWGLFCGGMSALLYAAMVICNKKAESIAGLENAALQLVTGFVTVAVFVGLKEGFAFQVAMADWPWVLLLGLVNTGIGCYFYFSSIGRLPVQTVAVCGYLEPLSAVALSALFLKEEMLPLQVLGAICIIGGAMAGELFGRRKAQS